MIHKRWGPGQPLVRAAGNNNVVEVRVRALLKAALARSVHDEHGMGRRIRDDGSLVVVERGHAGEPALTRDRIAHSRPREAVIVRSLHVNLGARTAVMVRGVYGSPVRGGR